MEGGNIEVSFINFILGIFRDQMEGEMCVTRSISDELHSWDSE